MVAAAPPLVVTSAVVVVVVVVVVVSMLVLMGLLLSEASLALSVSASLVVDKQLVLLSSASSLEESLRVGDRKPIFALELGAETIEEEEEEEEGALVASIIGWSLVALSDLIIAADG